MDRIATCRMFVFLVSCTDRHYANWRSGSVPALSTCPAGPRTWTILSRLFTCGKASRASPQPSATRPTRAWTLVCDAKDKDARASDPR